MSPVCGKHTKTMKEKITCIVLPNHIHTSVPLSQAEVTVIYGEAIRKSIIIPIMLYMIPGLSHDPVSQKVCVNILTANSAAVFVL